MAILFTGILFFSFIFTRHYIDKKLATKGAVFQYILREEGIIFDSNSVIDYLSLTPRGYDVIVIDPQNKKTVYLELHDDPFIFSTASKVLSRVLKERKEDETTYITINNKRILIGNLENNGKPYVYIMMFDVYQISLFLYILIFIFLFITFLSLIWNYYNTNNIMNTLLTGIDEITNSAKNIKGKNLSSRIDITSQNESISNLILTLNSMLSRVEKSFIQINEFTDNVSHELKTPITSIKSMIEVELTQERSVEEYQEVLEKILDEINWLHGIIQNLLIFTKNPEALEEHFKPIKIEKLILNLCEFLEILTFEKEISLNCNLSNNELEVLGDETLLRDIFLNVISNSIKYNKHKGKINVTSFVKDNMLGIEISDTGIGIKKENINKITERFFREDTVRTTKKSGSGLGLSIVSHLIEIHKGTLEIESVEGIGSKFTIYLPLIK